MSKPTGRKKLSPKEKEERQKQLLNETPEQRTNRVLVPRMVKAISVIRQIKQVTGNKRYALTEPQLIAIKDTLYKEVQGVIDSFSARQKTTKKEDIEFKL